MTAAALIASVRQSPDSGFAQEGKAIRHNTYYV